MSYSRRSFIRDGALTAILVTTGGFRYLNAAELAASSDKVKLRFVLASDAHYGQPDTPFDDHLDTMVRVINDYHQQHPLFACFINGDIIHNEPSMLAKSKTHLDQLKVPYYTGKGNHDMVSDAFWKDVWNTLPNHVVLHKKTSFIIANTSNEKGEYLSPDLNWLKEQLDAHQKQEEVFLVVHIPQKKWTKNAIDNPDFFDLLKKYKNIKAVFHGHEHDQDGVAMEFGVPYLFDSHIGGNWGTAYRGFRVVELLHDGSFITFIMNPFEKINESKY